jgi:hypothetical protein
MIAKLMKAGSPQIDRRDDEQELVHAARDDVFLQRQLDAVGIGCSRPKGPARFGPGRFCIRPMTRRSAQIMNSVVSSRNTKTARP